MVVHESPYNGIPNSAMHCMAFFHSGVIMFSISVPIWELIVRSIAVYAFLLLILRISGKRQVSQLAPFDLVLLLILSNAVQNSMNAGDNSLVGGLISAATLIVINYGVGWLTFRNKKLELILDGRPQVLIHNGKVFPEVMEKAKLTHHELSEALREAGCTQESDVHLAILETNGAISVIPKKREA